MDYFSEHHHKKYSYKRLKEGYIFVAISSYRDSRCSTTVKQLFNNATDPNKIIIGICQQNDSPDPDCGLVEKERKCQIKILRFPHEKAKGPTWARYLCSHLWDGEEFFLQIDAHMNFIKGWDTSLKDMRNQIGYRKNIITYYPPADTENVDLKTVTVVTTGASINSKNELISSARMIPRLAFPQEGNFVSAGFIFTNWEFLIDIPFDPYLPYLFQGEEPLLAMRLWTSGWKIYHPTHCVCDHFYARVGEPKFWDDHVKKYEYWNPISKIRALTFLGINPNSSGIPQYILKHKDSYGAGRSRTIYAWLELLRSKYGINWKLN